MLVVIKPVFYTWFTCYSSCFGICVPTTNCPVEYCTHLSLHCNLSNWHAFPVHQEWIARRKVVKFWLGVRAAVHRLWGIPVTTRQIPLYLRFFKKLSLHQLRRICAIQKFKLILGGIDRKVDSPITLVYLFLYPFLWSNKHVGWRDWMPVQTLPELQSKIS